MLTRQQLKQDAKLVMKEGKFKFKWRVLLFLLLTITISQLVFMISGYNDYANQLTKSATVAFEVLEELGWRIPRQRFRKVKVYGEPGRIAAFRDGSIWRMVIVVFALDLEAVPPIRISNESKEARFFTKEEVRQLQIAVTHSDIVEECFLNT